MAGLALELGGVGWDGQRATVAGMPADGFGVGGDRTATLVLLLGEMFSWAWTIGCVAFLLPAALLPLASSFGVSHTLWLRLTPCSPRELSAARAGRLLATVVAAGVVGGGWAWAAAAWHGLPWRGMLVPPLGALAHLLLAGAVVLLVGPRARSAVGRALTAFVGLLTPVVLFLVVALTGGRGAEPAAWRLWWPYAAPFTPALGDQLRHFGSAALLGLSLIGLSLVIPCGRVVWASPLTKKEMSE